MQNIFRKYILSIFSQSKYQELGFIPNAFYGSHDLIIQSILGNKTNIDLTLVHLAQQPILNFHDFFDEINRPDLYNLF